MLDRILFFLNLGLILLLHIVVIADCPLDLSRSNFTLAASLCSNQESRGKCCRYINAVIAISVSQYANTTSNLGVASDLSDICLNTISKTFELYGVTRNATAFCGFGTKIPLNYECQGRSTVNQMLQSPKFSNVTKNCKVPLSGDNACRKCMNAGILYLRNLLGPTDNITLSTCRDATFTALASRVDYISTIDIASCFFGIQDLLSPTGVLNVEFGRTIIFCDGLLLILVTYFHLVKQFYGYFCWVFCFLILCCVSICYFKEEVNLLHIFLFLLSTCAHFAW